MAATDLAEIHRRRNESTRERWESMAPHRARVTRLLTDARGLAGRSLCVLGAGNANDLDLATLAQQFERIVLVDLDPEALQHAVERLPASLRQSVESVGKFDLSGILTELDDWRAEQGSADGLPTLIDAARQAPTPQVGKFDVVASTCVLTQLIDSVYLRIQPENKLRQELVFAVRNRHLELMADLVEPNGVGILVTDFVSTDTAPEMATLSDAEFPTTAIRWINEHNFFTGANPYAIRDYLLYRSSVAIGLYNVAVSPAWRWDLEAKQLAVSAITFRRRID